MLLQVAFNLFIPCMLFTKVASTLASQPHVSLLAIPLVAMLQVRQYPSSLKRSAEDLLHMGSPIDANFSGDISFDM